MRRPNRDEQEEFYERTGTHEATYIRLENEIQAITQKYSDLRIRDVQAVMARQDIKEDQKHVTRDLIRVFNQLDSCFEKMTLYEKLLRNQVEWLEDTNSFYEHEEFHRDAYTIFRVPNTNVHSKPIEDHLEDILNRERYCRAFIQDMHEVLMNEELADLADTFEKNLHGGATDLLLKPMYTQVLDTLDKNQFYHDFLDRTDDLRGAIRPFRQKHGALVRPPSSSPGI
jgi:hypothetical protein